MIVKLNLRFRVSHGDGYEVNFLDVTPCVVVSEEPAASILIMFR
jgi:hypothetical protein